MRIKVFSSGSDGNSTIVVSNNKKILIDLGITRKQISENLNSMNLDILDLDAILITHEHTDHIKALPTMLKECHIPIYLSFGYKCDQMRPNFQERDQRPIRESCGK